MMRSLRVMRRHALPRPCMPARALPSRGIGIGLAACLCLAAGAVIDRAGPGTGGAGVMTSGVPAVVAPLHPAMPPMLPPGAAGSERVAIVVPAPLVRAARMVTPRRMWDRPPAIPMPPPPPDTTTTSLQPRPDRATGSMPA
ncbi:MAG: hypothetical protein AB7F35_25380 [Acetobacteraceae bacterium]